MPSNEFIPYNAATGDGCIRWLFGGDLHKRPMDISTIEGYAVCVDRVQASLVDAIKKNSISHFGSLGDWYDKGYASDVASSLAHFDWDTELSKVLLGNFYGVIGNHIRLRMDSNPELSLIQPHPTLKSRKRVARKEQIMRTPSVWFENGLQISFMHHRHDAKNALDYRAQRRPDTRYHIALYHTPAIIPNAMLSRTNYEYNCSPNSMISEALSGVDLAICGDIHIPLGQFTVVTKTGNCTMIVPGSLTNTDSAVVSRHTSVNLPMVTLYPNGEVALESLRFDLHTNLLTFKPKQDTIENKGLKTTRGKPIENFKNPDETLSVIDRGETLTLNRFHEAQGYSDNDKKLFSAILESPDNLKQLIEIYEGGLS